MGKSERPGKQSKAAYAKRLALDYLRLLDVHCEQSVVAD